MDWKMSEYRQMKGIEENTHWDIKGVMMALDRYTPKYYFPPVQMTVETFFYLRRN